MTITTQINSTVEYLKSTVVLSSANIKAMYATPVVLIPAKGPNTIVVLHSVFYEYVYSAPDYTGGTSGYFYLQYGNTIHGGSANLAMITPGILTSSASICGASTETNLNLVGTLSTSLVNVGIYASNATAAYATGNGSINCTMFYSIINTIA